MATTKPTFKHPPLETGIPQYPTPNVPDFYKKTGHIVLLEKVNAEKGAYNPQPLDGSIIYSGRDASKWPAPLYLVAEIPDEQGEFVMRYWANDRSMASQDAWNYNISYPDNDPEFPSYVRKYIIPRSAYGTSGYPPIAIGSGDPVFGVGAVLSEQEMRELPDENPLRSRYVEVLVKYEVLPSVEKPSNMVAAGLMGTKSEANSTVVNTEIPDPLDFITDGNGLGVSAVLQSSVSSIDGIKAAKKTVSSTGPFALSGQGKKSGLLGTTQGTESVVNYGSTADDTTISFNDAGIPISTIVQSDVAPIDLTKSQKTTVTSIGPFTLSGKSNKAGVLGKTTSTESIVAYGSEPDALSTTILSSEVTPIDGYKSKKTTTVSTEPTELDGKQAGKYGYITTAESVIPYGDSIGLPDYTTVSLEKKPVDLAKSILSKNSYDSVAAISGIIYDEQLFTTVTSSEIIVPAGTPLTIDNGLVSSRDEPIDIWKTIRIQRRIDSLPAPRIEYKVASYASPTLVFGLDVQSALIFDENVINSGGSPSITPSVTGTYAVRVDFDTRAAQSRFTSQRITTSYSYGDSTGNSTVADGTGDIFAPALTHVAFSGYKIVFDLGAALCDNLSFSGIQIGVASDGSVVNDAFTIPATTPSASDYLAAIGNTWKKISWSNEYWKSNIWVTTTIEVIPV